MRLKKYVTIRRRIIIWTKSAWTKVLPNITAILLVNSINHRVLWLTNGTSTNLTLCFKAMRIHCNINTNTIELIVVLILVLFHMHTFYYKSARKGIFISKFNKNERKFQHRTIVKWDYSCSILKFNITTTKNYESCRKRNYPDRNSYRYFNVILCNIHVLKNWSAPHITLCHLAVIVSGVRCH